MAGRPPLPLGTAGRITTRKVAPGRFRARAYFRGLDGAVREATKTAPTAAGAERLLKEGISERMRDGIGAAGPGKTVTSLATAWLEEVHGDPRKADSTKDRYTTIVESFVLPGLGNYRLRELTVPIVDRMLKDVSRDHGAATAKGVKSCLNGMLGLAVRHGLIATNPVRDTQRITVEAKQAPRALTPQEEADLMVGLRGSRRATEQDLVDLCEFMLGTGVRLGEACALREDKVDLEAGTVEIARTLGQGSVQDRTKTKAGWRILALPPHLVSLLRARIEDPDVATHVSLFPSPLGRLRNISNTTGELRRILDDLGYDWVSSHTFRKTVATRLDEAGLTPRQIADHLGHRRPSMTLDVYMGRQVACARAAEVLATDAQKVA